jgi:hypothetical protein
VGVAVGGAGVGVAVGPGPTACGGAYKGQYSTSYIFPSLQLIENCSARSSGKPGKKFHQLPLVEVSRGEVSLYVPTVRVQALLRR